MTVKKEDINDPKNPKYLVYLYPYTEDFDLDLSQLNHRTSAMKYVTIHEAYLGTLADVLDNPDCVSAPRGQPVREKFNYQFIVLNPQIEYIQTLDSERNQVIQDYSKKEFDLYDSGSNRVEDFATASKFWNKICNSDGTVNSAYGYLIWKYASHGNPKYENQYSPHPAFSGNVLIPAPKFRTPWEWAKETLIDDMDTRQSILRFSLPEHFYKGNKDFTCTLHAYFQIRNNKLDMTVNMRSNDLTLGLVYDLPWFISLIHRMVTELKPTYPNLEVGSYTHYVHNIHIYDRDLDKILKMLGRS